MLACFSDSRSLLKMSVILRKSDKKLTSTKMDTSCSVDRMNQFSKVFHNEIEMPRHTLKNISSAKERRKQKRFRSAFTTSQVTIMEQEFRKNPYVTNTQRELMANNLHLPERAIKIWFQNRRMKEKRDSSKISDTEIIAEQTSSYFKNQHTVVTLQPTLTITKTECQYDKESNETDSEIDAKENNNFSMPHNGFPENNITISGNEIVISKITKPKMKLYDDAPKENSFVSRETVREVNVKPTIIEKIPTPIERNIQQKQPVGHILPFSQVITSEPQKSPENLTLKTNRESAPAANEAKELEMSQYPGYYPLDLTKYYSPVPPVDAWNRLDFVPLMSGAPRGIQYNATPAMAKDTSPSFTSKKCCCDCHSLSSSVESPRVQPPYPVVYTQYIPHIMAQMQPQYPHSKY